TGAEALAVARRTGDRRLAARIQLRTADTLGRLGDPASAGLQRAAAERLLAEAEDATDAAYETRGKLHQA
ncbi:MAG TPA: hypothetical protein DEQ61_25260, partial [Streptomyces sp.]|nr:hypothetical protein [Streptomyces sp.]